MNTVLESAISVVRQEEVIKCTQILRKMIWLYLKKMPNNL